MRRRLLIISIRKLQTYAKKIIGLIHPFMSKEICIFVCNKTKTLSTAGRKKQKQQALDRSVETLGLWIATSSVTFIKSANQSSIKLCLIVHLVAVWTLIYSKRLSGHFYNICLLVYLQILKSAVSNPSVWCQR